MYEGIDGSSGYGASQGGYGGLGIGNPGSYGGSNSLDTSSTSTSVHDGSGHNGSSSHSSSNASSGGSEQSRSEGGFEGLGIGNPGSYCSVSDLFSGTPQTTSSEEEKETNEVTKESGMLPCPDEPPKNDTNWKSYDETGNPAVFHCGYEGYLEARQKPPGSLTNECFYDEMGTLVDKHHPHAACGGTPDEYPPDSLENQIKHTFIDSGGIVRSGVPAFIESREVEMERIKESILSEIQEFENQIVNRALPYDFRR